MSEDVPAYASEMCWVDERDQEFNAEVHELLDTASEAIDGVGALEAITATLTVIDKLRAKLIEERDRRTATAKAQTS